jgi:myo-inositol-1(or 4)-monophosphatase
VVNDKSWERNSELVRFVRELTGVVGASVRPHLGSAASKEIEGRGASGDATFSIDHVAERVVEEFLSGHAEFAYYTEDRGLVVLGEPRYVLVIDPIDGTRPAAAGLESCCVSVAVAEFAADPETLTVEDVFLGVVSEMKNDATFLAIKGSGVRIDIEGEQISPRLSEKTELGNIFWTAGFRGRPAEPLVTVIGELIDLSSVDGGCFDLGSATFSITRVVKGEMDVYVDVGQRMAEESGAVRDRFLEVGHGAILNNYPYDLAAAALIAEESGAVVSDAYGRPLGTCPLIPRQGGGQMSSIVSANPVLHQKVLEHVEGGIARLKARYGSL